MEKISSSYVKKKFLVPSLLLPKPFPGDFPTRISVEITLPVTFGAARPPVWKYIGKPNWTVFERIRRTLENTRGAMVRMSEFDRGGSITTAHIAGPYVSTEWPTGAYHRTLWHYYHPWQTLPVCLSWLRSPYKTKRVKYKGKILRVYGPQDKLTTEQLETYKRWLRQYMAGLT